MQTTVLVWLCLAVLASKDIKHGPIEVLLTIDEEAGMTGAFGLVVGWKVIFFKHRLRARRRSVHGLRWWYRWCDDFDIKRDAIPTGFVTRQLTLKGLKGGHSGCDIHTGRGNANKLLGRFLAGHAQELDLQAIEFRGGSLQCYSLAKLS